MHVFKSTFIFLAAVGAIAGASTGPLGCGPTHPHGYCAEVTAWDPSRENWPLTYALTETNRLHGFVFERCDATRTSWCCLKDFDLDFRTMSVWSFQTSRILNNCRER
ncbi:hypothetical protein Pst134EA_028961 [Puccinia striiformis f. sp. tritici]|uniref:hypothetical protein n=1 Tax=Puccinia striiformis f. sp. tritici TaxID=168172 RepID=UPI002008969E|nr:hypothetical protein Pst134EA_028961 [Puccinia striiformis f. sp. tritici]KAH9441012.1 hypothetical protein Pst134EB_029664 [Puccinia striiformis f. sp. tritici]KAH9446976.1 hypothetical protein Pst134EA_028961 [Puccinia striiformis f. sp. tritici]KAI9617296.1 hypothetical protein H4Q26_013165 [Puccinia striiformis f. sp. tritici PST-130]KAI9630208.1 hypothetical protein KEM48_012241 [Puccinia striiformis f. sp. tritici PST-130]